MARLIYVYLTALICFGVASAMDVYPMYVPGVPHKKPLTRALARATAKCENGDGPKLKCADCSNILYCNDDATVFNMPCSSFKPGNNYCDITEPEGTCTSTPPAGCDSEINSDKICLFEGYQPDPESCTSYYYCNSFGLEATKYDCPPNRVYAHNSTMGKCKAQTSEADCAKMECNGKTYASYSPDMSIFGICENNAVKFVNQCQDKEHEWFDQGKCKIICRTDGEIFADIHDTNQYYECYISDNKWYARHVKCPSGKKFDNAKSRCV